MKLKLMIIGVVFLSVELFFFAFWPKSDLEMFFMLWGAFHLVVLTYTIFRADSDSANSGRVNTLMFLSRNLVPPKSAEKAKHGSRKSDVAGEGLYNKYNIVYLLFFLMNAAVYIIVMPK